MDVYMNIFMLANYVNASIRVAKGAGHLWCIVLSAVPFFSMFSTIDWDFYILM